MACGRWYRRFLVLQALRTSTRATVQNEVLGPVLTMQTFSAEADAMEIANDSMRKRGPGSGPATPTSTGRERVRG